MSRFRDLMRRNGVLPGVLGAVTLTVVTIGGVATKGWSPDGTDIPKPPAAPAGETPTPAPSPTESTQPAPIKSSEGVQTPHAENGYTQTPSGFESSNPGGNRNPNTIEFTVTKRGKDVGFSTGSSREFRPLSGRARA